MARQRVTIMICHTPKTRRALSGWHEPPTKVFRRLTKKKTASVNETIAAVVGRKTILKPCLAAVTNTYVGFSQRKIPCSMAYTTAEKAIRFRHPNYNPDRAQKLISSSMSRHLSTYNISSKSITRFWVILLTDRQTDRQTWANAFTSSFVGGKKINIISWVKHTPRDWRWPVAKDPTELSGPCQ